MAEAKALARPRCSRRRPWSRALACTPAAAMVVHAAAWPQTAPPRLSVEPVLTVEQTFTDNIEPGAAERRAEAVTRIGPGLRITSRHGAVVGSLDYGADLLVYARDDARNTVRHALAAQGSARLLDEHLDIDLRAGVARQAISAFGTRTGDAVLVDANLTEVSTLALAPTLRFNLGSEAAGSVRLAWNSTRAASTDAGDADSFTAALSAGGRHGIFRWSAAASHVVDDFAAGRRTTQDEAVATFGVAPWREASFFVRAGWEANDVLGPVREHDRFAGLGLTLQPHDTLSLTLQRDHRGFGPADGLSVQWLPTARTRVSVSAQERYFGRSHGVSVSHRFTRLLLSYTDTRGLTGGDLLEPGTRERFEAYQDALARCAALPRPEEQSTCVVRALQEAYGRFGNGIAGVLATAVAEQRVQTFGLFHPWIRTTVGLTLNRTASSSLLGVTSVLGDLSLTDRVVQYGASATLSHRFTRETSLALGASRQVTADARPGAGPGVLPGNELRQFTATLSTTLGPRTTGAVGVRHAQAEGGPRPWRETALTGRIVMRF